MRRLIHRKAAQSDGDRLNNYVGPHGFLHRSCCAACEIDDQHPEDKREERGLSGANGVLTPRIDIAVFGREPFVE
jgi:hypothetical protein